MSFSGNGLAPVDDLLREFQQLLAGVGDGIGGGVELLLGQMEPPRQRQLRLCAIPHEFDADVLQVMDPDLPRSDAEAACAEFASLAIVLSGRLERLTLHDAARAHLFRSWLRPEWAEDFQKVNARLADNFERLSSSSNGVVAARVTREAMFHRLGADAERGMQEFRELFQRSWRQLRLSDCEALVTLVQEYAPSLGPDHDLWLTYHEGRLATARREWVRALELFRSVMRDEDATIELKIRAHQRAASVHSKRGQPTDAIPLLEDALSVARDHREGAHLIDDVLQDLGVAYRNSGDVRKGQRLLEESIEVAEHQGDHHVLALAYNSLGGLHHRLGDAQQAVGMYERALEQLEALGDPFRPAQVLNNLGRAHVDLGDWTAGLDVLNRSLDIKTEAGDTRGQAVALKNLAKIHQARGAPQEAIQALARAAGLFRAVHDFHGAGSVLASLARILGQQNKLERAVATFEEAAALLDQAGESVRAALVRREAQQLVKPDRPWIWIAVAVGIVVAVVAFIVIWIESG